MSDRFGALVARGVFWTGAGQVLRQVIQVVGSVVLARMLDPDDFGLLGMAMFFVGFGQLFADFGIGAAIVHAQPRESLVLSSCFWVNLAIAAAFAMALFGASPLISDFFKRDDLRPLVAVLSLTLLIAGAQAVPQALLYRDMRFADIARLQVLGSLSGALIAIAIAWRGAGVWALIAQPIAGSAISLIASFYVLRWLPSLHFSWRTVEPMVRYSMALLGTALLGYAYRNADSMLVGRFIGAAALGIYSMAIQLMLYPLQQVSSVVVRVLFPTMAQLQDDLPRLRDTYLRAVGMIALVTFPMMGGLFAVADDFVAVVFGQDWIELIPVLKVVAWLGMMQSVGATIGTIYLGVGKPGVGLRISLIGTPITILGMAAGVPWGIVGVAVGYSITGYILFYYTLAQTFRLVDLSIARFNAVIVRPLVATLAMAATVVVIRWSIDLDSALLRLATCVACGIVAYALFTLLVNRAQLHALAKGIRALRTPHTGERELL